MQQHPSRSSPSRRAFLAAVAVAAAASVPALLAVSPRPAAAQSTPPSAYRILDMGLMAGTYRCEPRGVSHAGQIIGDSYRQVRKDVVGYHAFVWENGTYFPLLPMPGRDSATAADVSGDAAVVVGLSRFWSGSASSPSIPTIWRRTGGTGTPYVASDLNAMLPPGSGWTLSLPSGVSPGGRYVAGIGYYAPDGGGQHGFVAELSPDHTAIVRIAALGNLGGRAIADNAAAFTLNSQARAVNDAGQVCGSAQTGDVSGLTNVTHAFRVTPLDADQDGSPDTWFLPRAGAADPMDNALMEDLGTLGTGLTSVGTGINAAGQVTGSSRYDASLGSIMAFLWTPGGNSGGASNPQMQGLGLLPGLPSTLPRGMTDGGLIVGGATSTRGFVWTTATGMLDLNGLKAPGDASYLELKEAWGVNNAGWITGMATETIKRTSYSRAFLAIPVP